MRIKTLAHSFAITLSAAWPLLAQLSPDKVAAISMQSAIVESKDGQKASKELEASAKLKQQEFEQRSNQAAQLEDQLNKGASVLSEGKRAQLSRDVEQQKKQLERDVSDARDSFTAQQQKVLETLGKRMLASIQAYAKEKGFLLVLDTSNPDTAVLFASPAIDITKEVIARFDMASSTKTAPPNLPGDITRPRGD